MFFKIMLFSVLFLYFLDGYSSADEFVGIWMKYEKSFISQKEYDNPLYEVSKFSITFTSPSGREKKSHGFWDGGNIWKVRFCPDELGLWNFESNCSDEKNSGLHLQTGTFNCVKHDNKFEIYNHGLLVRPKGYYHLTFSDGNPFFYAACTAWNGALLSTDDEWKKYLTNRMDTGYSVIQFVTTQWRGCEVNSLGQIAFEGSGRIKVNPQFFQHLDKKVDQINAHGLVAAPVLLWALPGGKGRYLSPGYYLPQEEAILLAKYIVARYSGNHVIWILGGDGRYVNEYEQRWKNIGRGVFGEEHPGLVAQHPQGRSWIGWDYRDENWLDIVGYQSSHSNAQRTVDWINKGPITTDWYRIPAKPILNLEPNYEEIRFSISATDVRNASYWSILATPVAGITYGANGIWPWLRTRDEMILNHETLTGYTPWFESIYLPGSKQIGYLANFFRAIEWWRLRPSTNLLKKQPGEDTYNQFISVAKTENHDLIVAYLPVKSEINLFNPLRLEYTGKWFDPVENKYSKAEVKMENGNIYSTSPKNSDMVLLLQKL